MGKYLKEAFWASVRVPLLGYLPFNALVVAGGLIFGFIHPSVWLLTLGLETAWLFGLATNTRFQRWVDAKNRPAPPPSAPADALPPEDQQKSAAIQAKVREALEAYRRNQTDPLIFEANRDALVKLADIFSNLLGARASLREAHRRTNASELQSQLAALEAELASSKLAPAIRGSKQATAEILRQRLANEGKRATALAQIESDLIRVSAQVDLAVENAVVRGSTDVLSSKIELASQLLANPHLPELSAEPHSPHTPESPPPPNPPTRQPMAQ